MPKSSGRRTSKPGIPRTRVSSGRSVQTTLGELIAAAFDTVGNQVTDVARLLASPQIGRATHRHIVLVQ